MVKVREKTSFFTMEITCNVCQQRTKEKQKTKKKQGKKKLLITFYEIRHMSWELRGEFGKF